MKNPYAEAYGFMSLVGMAGFELATPCTPFSYKNSNIEPQWTLKETKVFQIQHQKNNHLFKDVR